MATWGTGPFDNDAAGDWLGELGAKKTPAAKVRFVTSTFCRSTALDDRDVERGVAAAEAAAWLAGRGRYPADDVLSELVREGLGVSPLEIDRARRFLLLASRRASLMGWTDPRDQGRWLEMLGDLSRRLGGEGLRVSPKKTAKKTAKKARRR